jgi:ferredoxin
MSATDTVTVRFISPDGQHVDERVGRVGETLLDVAQAAGQPLEGTCEGQMACSTCHVIVDAEDFGKLPRASEAEEDMLDLAAAATRTSRLACQILLKAEWSTLTVRLPGSWQNMQGL